MMESVKYLSFDEGFFQSGGGGDERPPTYDRLKFPRAEIIIAVYRIFPYITQIVRSGEVFMVRPYFCQFWSTPCA